MLIQDLAISRSNVCPYQLSVGSLRFLPMYWLYIVVGVPKAGKKLHSYFYCGGGGEDRRARAEDWGRGDGLNKLMIAW